MIIGILSDTHGRIEAMKEAMSVLRARSAEFFIHCGDVGSEEVLDCLAGVPSAFVFGNNDWERNEYQRYADSISVKCLGAHGELELDGKLFAVMHGDDTRLMRQVIVQQRCDYLLFGHTHLTADRREGRVRLINPGALHRAKIKSVATLDTRRDALEFHTIIA